jgi:hypothetical protein
MLLVLSGLTAEELKVSLLPGLPVVKSLKKK